MNIKRRIEGLEKRARTRNPLTLEVLVSASWGNPEAIRKLETIVPDDPLIRLICKAGKSETL